MIRSVVGSHNGPHFLFGVDDAGNSTFRPFAAARTAARSAGWPIPRSASARIRPACSLIAADRIGSEEGALSDTIAAIAKMNNTSKARQVISEARDLLGGNGILLDFHVMRHLADMEALHTYEGTETIQTLIVGRDIPGVGAFT